MSINVSLSPDLEKFVADEVKSGKYSSADAVIRDGLRLLREQKEGERQNGGARIATPVTAEKEWRWIREHKEEYRGQWVALDGDRLVAHGTDARSVFEKARAVGVKVPALIEIPSEPELPWGGW